MVFVTRREDENPSVRELIDSASVLPLSQEGLLQKPHYQMLPDSAYGRQWDRITRMNWHYTEQNYHLLAYKPDLHVMYVEKDESMLNLSKQRKSLESMIEQRSTGLLQYVNA